MNKLALSLLVTIAVMSVATYLAVQEKPKPTPTDISVLQKEYDECKKFWGDTLPANKMDPCYLVLINPKRYGREPDVKAEKLAWQKSFF